MNQSFIDFLHTPDAITLYDIIDSCRGDTLKIHNFFRKKTEKPTYLEFLPDMLLLDELRKKATEKFSHAADMLFTRRGLEQSTGEHIATYKASWVATDARVLVLCGGIGGEILALAEQVSHVTAIDNDQSMCLIAKYNTNALHLAERVTIVEDSAEHFLQVTKEHYDAIFIDPDRRANDVRTVTLSQYLPNVYEILPQMLAVSNHVYCKVSPRISRRELDTISNVSFEFIQEELELKECVLHFTKEPLLRRNYATKIVRNTVLQYPPLSTAPIKNVLCDIDEMGTYLYEPDPSIMRAELVGDCAAQIHGTFLSELGALLSTTTLSAFGKTWGTYFEMIQTLPFHPATLRAYCKEKNIEKVIIKKRYFPLEPHELRQSLKIKEGGNDIFYCTTLGEKKVILHCRRVLHG